MPRGQKKSTEDNLPTGEILSGVSNDGQFAIDTQIPYIVRVTITGTSDVLFHRWSCEAVEEKAKAAKGSKAKKTDDIESFIYRDEDGCLAIPGEYLRQSIINAAKYRQDPRSSRKSAMDLYKAGIISLTALATTGHKTWDYIDRRRVMIQRAGVTRERPALRKGWKATFDLMVNLPEYITPEGLVSVINDAGRLVGIADFRPTYGRFAVTGFQVV